MMYSKKGQGMTWGQIVLAVLALIFLVIAIMVLAGQFGDFNKNLKNCRSMGKEYKAGYSHMQCIGDGGIPRPLRIHKEEDKKHLNYCCILPLEARTDDDEVSSSEDTGISEDDLSQETKASEERMQNAIDVKQEGWEDKVLDEYDKSKKKGTPSDKQKSLAALALLERDILSSYNDGLFYQLDLEKKSEPKKSEDIAKSINSFQKVIYNCENLKYPELNIEIAKGDSIAYSCEVYSRNSQNFVEYFRGVNA
jgi:hypothetical protein